MVSLVGVVWVCIIGIGFVSGCCGKEYCPGCPFEVYAYDEDVVRVLCGAVAEKNDKTDETFFIESIISAIKQILGGGDKYVLIYEAVATNKTYICEMTAIAWYDKPTEIVNYRCTLKPHCC